MRRCMCFPLCTRAGATWMGGGRHPGDTAFSIRAEASETESEPVALFLPVVRVVVVAVALPEPGLVGGGELEAAQPLRGLPEVLRGDEQADRVAVLRGQRLAVCLVDDEGVLVLEGAERGVRREAVLGVRDHVAGRWPGAAELCELAPVDALELLVE